MSRHRSRIMALALLSLAATAFAQNKRDQAVLKDKLALSKDESWYYENLERARKVAAETKRPLMIVFR